MTRAGRGTAAVAATGVAGPGALRSAMGALLAAALVLTGCSSPEPPATDSAVTTGTTAASAAARPVAARSGGFTLVPAASWVEATDRAGEVAGLDLVVLSSVQVAKFNSNLVVTSAAGGEADLKAELARGRDQLAGAGRTISEAPDQQIAGETATGFSSAFEEQGIPVLARSYGVLHDGRIYLLTLSSSPEQADQAMAELRVMLDGWRWT